MQKKRVKNLSFMQAIFPILVMLVVLGIGVGGLGLPAEPLIVLATVAI